MLEAFRRELALSGRRVLEVAGDWEARFAAATRALDALLREA
jgi:hypothetical protein